MANEDQMVEKFSHAAMSSQLPLLIPSRLVKTRRSISTELLRLIGY